MHRHVLPVLLTIAGTATAQTTWVVGAGGAFLEIQQAIDSPSVRSGDVLQLVSGPLPHEGFTLTKGITIRGPAVIQGDALYRGSYVTVMTIPGNEHARLVDLDFRPGRNASSLLVTCRGLVSFDRCQVRGEGLHAAGGAITFDHCDLVGGPTYSCLSVEADVAAVASTFTSAPGASGNCVQVISGSLHGSSITIVGPNHPFSSIGLWTYGTAIDVWLADSTITAVVNAIQVNLSRVQLARCTVNGPVVGMVTVNPALLGAAFAQTAPQLGQPYDLTVRGLPNTPIVVLLSVSLARSLPASFAEPVWFPSQFYLLATGVTDATGALTVNSVIPASPSLRNLGLWAHALGSVGGVLHAAPPTGGVVR